MAPDYHVVESFGAKRRMSQNASVDHRLETKHSANTITTQKVRYEPLGIKEANSQRFSIAKLKMDTSVTALQKPPKPQK